MGSAHRKGATPPEGGGDWPAPGLRLGAPRSVGAAPDALEELWAGDVGMLRSSYARHVPAMPGRSILLAHAARSRGQQEHALAEILERHGSSIRCVGRWVGGSVDRWIGESEQVGSCLEVMCGTSRLAADGADARRGCRDSFRADWPPPCAQAPSGRGLPHRVPPDRERDRLHADTRRAVRNVRGGAPLLGRPLDGTRCRVRPGLPDVAEPRRPAARGLMPRAR